MNNCYVSLAGGVGNQLFQIANGYAYSKKYSKNLVLDSSHWGAGQGNNPRCYEKSFFKQFKFGSPDMSRPTPLLQETKFNYQELPRREGNVILSGYYQSIKYFDENLEFLDLLNFTTQENLDISFMENPNVAVHIRRGDYMRHPDKHLVCGTDYFRRNIEKFPNHQINVFTDSPEYVQKELEGMDVNIINGGSEINDLYLMSLHDNIICSNSTFSWWASLLKNKKEKIIVPKVWFKNFGEDYHDIYRNDFIISEI